MLDWSDRHYRYLVRLLSRHTRVYTEMVTTGALLYGDAQRHLDYSPEEHPIALQLGGADPFSLAKATELAAKWGYDEVNLNCGCPSDRVQNGAFGACLMATPELVADAVNAMQQAAPELPITVKSRIGIDHQDDYPSFQRFVATVAESGHCGTFIVHIRKAWLSGLSPKQNREVPPLVPEFAQRIKQEYPHLNIVINGGLNTLPEMQHWADELDGVMVGRAAYQQTGWLSEIDPLLFNDNAPHTPESALQAYHQYCQQQVATGTRMTALIKPILGLFHGRPGARQFRRHLSEQAPKRQQDAELILEAFEHIAPALSKTAAISS